MITSLWIGSHVSSKAVSQPIIKRTKREPELRNKVATRRINIRTRGVENFRQIGTLYNDGTVLPLYGRPTYSSSSKWNYYAVTNDHIHIQVP